MAEETKIVYTADVEAYNQSLSEAIMMTERYASVVDTTAGTVAKAGIGISRAITKVLTPPGMGMTPAVQQAAAYEQQLSLLGARAKVSGQDIERLTRDVKELGRNMPMGMGEAVKQMESLQRAGKTGENLKELTSEMMKLGAATGEVSVGLSTSMAQFSRTFQQFDPKGVSNLSDSVTALTASFGSSASATMDFANAVAPLSKVVGMSSTDVLGFSSAFASAGESGYRAANVFNRMLTDMERAARTGSPQIRGYAEAVGMTSQEFENLVKNDPTEAVVQFFEAIKGGGKDAMRILEQVGLDGPRALKSIQDVAGQGGLREKIAEASSSYGSGAQEIAAKEAFDGLNDSLTKTGESMSQMVSGAVQPYVDVMGNAAQVTEKVSSATAGLMQSEGFQQFASIMTNVAIGKGVLGMFGTLGTSRQLGMTAANMLAGPVAFARERGIDDFSKRYRGELKMGGLVGLGVGAASGNPMVMGLGALAMLLGPGNSALQGFGRRTATWLADTTYGTSEGAMRLRDTFGIEDGKAQASRGGRLYNLSQRLQAATAFGRGGWARMPNSGMAGGIDYDYEWSKEDQDRFNQQLKEQRRTAMAAGGSTAARYFGRRAVNAVGQVGISSAAALAPMMNPWVLGGAAVVGGGVYAYNRYQAGVEASEGPSALAEFGEKTGIATRGLEQFTLSMEKATKEAKSVGDALAVTSEEMAMVQSENYQAEFNAPRGRAEEDIIRTMAALGSNQSPAMQQRIVNDIAAMFGADAAERMGQAAFGENAQNPLVAAAEFAQREYRGTDEEATGFEWMRYHMTDRREEAISTMQAAGANIRAAFESDKQVLGEYAAINKMLDETIPVVAEAFELAPTDREMEEAIAALPGMGTDTAASIKDRIQEIQDRGRSQNPATGKPWTTQEALEKALEEQAVKEGELTWLEKWTERRDELAGKTATFYEELAGLNIVNVNEMNTVAEKMRDTGRSMDSLLAEYDAFTQAKKKQAEGLELEEADQLALDTGTKLTAAEAQAVRMITQPENIQAQATYRWEAINKFSGGRTGTDLGEAIARAERWRLERGELSPEQLQSITSLYEGQMASANMEQQFGVISGGQASAQRISAAREALKGTGYETGVPKWSDETTVAQMQMEAYEVLRKEQMTLDGMKQSFLEGLEGIAFQQEESMRSFNFSADYARESAGISRGRAESDFERQQGYALADYQRQEGYAREDFAKQRARAEEDYQRSVERSTADFNKQLARTEEDYYRQRAYSLEDFNRGRQRSQEDYDKSMIRAAEDTARQMMNPMQRLGAQRTWSAGGLAGNLAEQNEAVREQLETLDALREQGLSQEAIDLLGLADAANARQTIGLAGMSEDEIAALNAQAAERMGLGEEVMEESVGYRRSAEDFALAMARQMEDFNRSLQRQDEEFRRSRERAIEDFNLGLERSSDDFNRSMARSSADFEVQMSRSWESYTISSERAREQLNLSLDRMDEDLERSLKHQEDLIGRQAEASRRALIHSYEELQLDVSERDRLFEEAMNGEVINFEGRLTSRFDTMKDALVGTSSTAATESETAHGEAQGDIADTGKEARDEIADTAEDIEGLGEDIKGFSRDAVREINDVWREGKDTIMGSYTEALKTIMNLYSSTTSTAASSAKNAKEKFEKELGDYAWMFEAGKGSVTANKKEILVKFDEESFNRTWKKLSAGGTGGGVPAAPGVTGSLAVTGGKGRFSQAYGVVNSNYAAGYHTGVDIAAPSGTPLYATGKGSVVQSGWNGAYGQSVTVDLDDYPIRLLYGHMSSRAVPVGARVMRGTGLGRVGSTGNSSGPHLHLEARVWPYTYGSDEDPAPYMYNGGVAMRPGWAMVAEHSPEAIVPLNGKGAAFMADVISRYSAQTPGMSRSRVGGAVTIHNTSVTNIHNDSSVHAATIQVAASDPDAMLAEVRRRTARSRLASKV